MMVRYSALFQPDVEKGGYVVTFPDFGYGVTQGESMAEAARMARDLLACTIGDFIKAEKDLPKPGSNVDGSIVKLPCPQQPQ